MGELPFLDNYQGQTIDEIIAMRGRFRDDSLVLAIESALIEREGWFDILEGEDNKEQIRQKISSFTDAERIVMTVEAMEREVNNGGFEQFFVNSSRYFAPHLIESLQAIGCTRHAVLAASAIAELRLPPQYDGEACERAYLSLMDEIDPKLQELDSQYYDCGEAESPCGRLFSYIEQHASEIRIPRVV